MQKKVKKKLINELSKSKTGGDDEMKKREVTKIIIRKNI